MPIPFGTPSTCLAWTLYPPQPKHGSNLNIYTLQRHQQFPKGVLEAIDIFHKIQLSNHISKHKHIVSQHEISSPRRQVIRNKVPFIHRYHPEVTPTHTINDTSNGPLVVHIGEENQLLVDKICKWYEVYLLSIQVRLKWQEVRVDQGTCTKAYIV